MRKCFSLNILLSVFLLFAAIVACQGVQPDEVLSDSKLEQRARAIAQQLRCPVCQNETIDDSSASLARDLRLLIRQRLVAGDSDRQIIGFIVGRYGEFVLLKPPFTAKTLLLWLAPLMAVIIAVSIVIIYWSGRSPPLSECELQRLRLLLAGKKKHERNGGDRLEGDS